MTSSSGMNMTGTEGGAAGGSTNNTTVTRDTVTILLEENQFLEWDSCIFMTPPYKIGNGHIALHVPCDSSSKPIVNVLV